MAFPAAPFAMTETMSFVDVSPSMLIMLKLPSMSSERARSSMEGEIAASVVMNTSIVAMFGCIIPLPLAQPPMRQRVSPTENSYAVSLRRVSVVMIASAAREPPSGLRPDMSSGIARTMTPGSSG